MIVIATATVTVIVIEFVIVTIDHHTIIKMTTQENIEMNDTAGMVVEEVVMRVVIVMTIGVLRMNVGNEMIIEIVIEIIIVQEIVSIKALDQIEIMKAHHHHLKIIIALKNLL